MLKITNYFNATLTPKDHALIHKDDVISIIADLLEDTPNIEILEKMYIEIATYLLDDNGLYHDKFRALAPNFRSLMNLLLNDIRRLMIRVYHFQPTRVRVLNSQLYTLNLSIKYIGYESEVLDRQAISLCEESQLTRNPNHLNHQDTELWMHNFVSGVSQLFLAIQYANFHQPYLKHLRELQLRALDRKTAPVIAELTKRAIKKALFANPFKTYQTSYELMYRDKRNDSFWSGIKYFYFDSFYQDSNLTINNALAAQRISPFDDLNTQAAALWATYSDKNPYENHQEIDNPFIQLDKNETRILTTERRQLLIAGLLKTLRSHKRLLAQATEAAMSTSPKLIPLSPTNLNSIHLFLAEYFESIERPKKALKHFLSITADSPLHGEAYFHASRLLTNHSELANQIKPEIIHANRLQANISMKNKFFSADQIIDEILKLESVQRYLGTEGDSLIPLKTSSPCNNLSIYLEDKSDPLLAPLPFCKNIRLMHHTSTINLSKAFKSKWFLLYLSIFTSLMAYISWLSKDAKKEIYKETPSQWRITIFIAMISLALRVTYLTAHKLKQHSEASKTYFPPFSDYPSDKTQLSPKPKTSLGFIRETFNKIYSRNNDGLSKKYDIETGTAMIDNTRNNNGALPEDSTLRRR